MKRERAHSILRMAAALAFVFATAARAHGPFGTLSEQAYERMRELAHDLDGQAQHATDQALHQESWFYGHDRQFLRSVTNFARRASQFHARMDNYRTAPWQVDDELRSLLRDARAVQSRLLRTRYADEHTVADWNEVVRTLNEMVRTYRADTDTDRYGSPAYHGPARPPESRYRDREYVNPGGARAPYESSRGDIAALAHELAERTARVAESIRGAAYPSPFDSSQAPAIQALEHFAKQARTFHERVESGLTPDQLRGNVGHLADDAQAASEKVRPEILPQQVRGDWNAAMQLVERLRTLTGA